MIVYRIESKDHGKGPYLDRVLGKKIQWDHHDEQHPCFLQDGIRGNPHFARHHAGFDSEEKMSEWFKGYGKKLKKCNYHIVVYDAEDDFVIHGKSQRQVAFRRLYSKFVKKKEIDFM